MKLIVLAAGYATRLYPLTLDRPKALLPVAGRPMVEHVLDRVAAIEELDRLYLGAIGDLELVVSREGVDDDVVVVAGDNLFTESLEDFGRFGREQDAPVLAVYDVGTLDAIRSYSAIETDESGRITSFEEKPAAPRSTLAGIALYFYPRSALPLVRRYLEEGNNPDQPGRLIEWLYTRTPVYTWRVPGVWLDIGSEETLREADRVLRERAP
jgi:glucose-1-phosphate thymidylyltransferase